MRQNLSFSKGMLGTGKIPIAACGFKREWDNEASVTFVMRIDPQGNAINMAVRGWEKTSCYHKQKVPPSGAICLRMNSSSCPALSGFLSPDGDPVNTSLSQEYGHLVGKTLFDGKDSTNHKDRFLRILPRQVWNAYRHVCGSSIGSERTIKSVYPTVCCPNYPPPTRETRNNPHKGNRCSLTFYCRRNSRQR